MRATDPKEVQERFTKQAKETQAKVSETLGDIDTDIKKLREQAQHLALQSVGVAAEYAVKARETYDELADRGRGAVKTWRGEDDGQAPEVTVEREPVKIAEPPAEPRGGTQSAAKPGARPPARAPPRRRAAPRARRPRRKTATAKTGPAKPTARRRAAAKTAAPRSRTGATAARRRPPKSGLLTQRPAPTTSFAGQAGHSPDPGPANGYGGSDGRRGNRPRIQLTGLTGM